MQLVNIEGALSRYFDVLEELREKSGPVLVQLPPQLSYDKSLMCNFLNLLKDQYSFYRFALEVRHESWIRNEFFDLLAQYGTAFVIADSGSRYPYSETVTTDFVYLRLHGREQLYASDYSDTDLGQYAEKIIHWLNEDKKVWVFFNNDYHGFAVSNAEKLKEIVNLL